MTAKRLVGQRQYRGRRYVDRCVRNLRVGDTIAVAGAWYRLDRLVKRTTLPATIMDHVLHYSNAERSSYCQRRGINPIKVAVD